MIRIMIDTNIYDKIVSDGLQDRLSDLRQRGYIKLITTHVQLDEASDIRDDRHREQLMAVEASCTRTSLSVWGYSPWDKCEWGNDAAISLFDTLKADNENHVPDAIIGTTAALKTDILVTEDKKFSKRLGRIAPSITVYNYSTFKELLDSVA